MVLVEIDKLSFAVLTRLRTNVHLDHVRPQHVQRAEAFLAQVALLFLDAVLGGLVVLEIGGGGRAEVAVRAAENLLVLVRAVHQLEMILRFGRRVEVATAATVLAENLFLLVVVVDVHLQRVHVHEHFFAVNALGGPEDGRRLFFPSRCFFGDRVHSFEVLFVAVFANEQIANGAFYFVAGRVHQLIVVFPLLFRAEVRGAVAVAAADHVQIPVVRLDVLGQIVRVDRLLAELALLHVLVVFD